MQADLPVAGAATPPGRWTGPEASFRGLSPRHPEAAGHPEVERGVAGGASRSNQSCLPHRHAASTRRPRRASHSAGDAPAYTIASAAHSTRSIRRPAAADSGEPAAPLDLGKLGHESYPLKWRSRAHAGDPRPGDSPRERAAGRGRVPDGCVVGRLGPGRLAPGGGVRRRPPGRRGRVPLRSGAVSPGGPSARTRPPAQGGVGEHHLPTSRSPIMTARRVGIAGYEGRHDRAVRDARSPSMPRTPGAVRRPTRPRILRPSCTSRPDGTRSPPSPGSTRRSRRPTRPPRPASARRRGSRPMALVAMMRRTQRDAVHEGPAGRAGRRGS